MPPKAKITREDILKCAYELALQDGFSSLSSRNLAHALGCSVQPVFSHFPTMEALKQEIYQYACTQCAEEVLVRTRDQDLLTTLTLWMLDLAKNRPNLFELLYLSSLNGARTLPEALVQSANHRKMIQVIADARDLSLKESEDILIRSCIFLMGIGTMICINKVDMGEKEILCLMRRTVDDFVSGRKAEKRTGQ